MDTLHRIPFSVALVFVVGCGASDPHDSNQPQASSGGAMGMVPPGSGGMVGVYGAGGGAPVYAGGAMNPGTAGVPQYGAGGGGVVPPQGAGGAPWVGAGGADPGVGGD